MPAPGTQSPAPCPVVPSPMSRRGTGLDCTGCPHRWTRTASLPVTCSDLCRTPSVVSHLLWPLPDDHLESHPQRQARPQGHWACQGRSNGGRGAFSRAHRLPVMPWSSPQGPEPQAGVRARASRTRSGRVSSARPLGRLGGQPGQGRPCTVLRHRFRSGQRANHRREARPGSGPRGPPRPLLLPAGAGRGSAAGGRRERAPSGCWLTCPLPVT